MRYIALNGFRHSLDRYFTDAVECVNAFNWTPRNARRFATELDQTDEPKTVIGFLDGASAAVAIARHSRTVVEVFAHSPMYWEDETRVKARSVSLFRTKGDRTPTFEAAKVVFDKLFQWGGYSVSLDTLKPLPALPIRDAATLMWWKVHQFHNCLPYLPPSIVREEWSE